LFDQLADHLPANWISSKVHEDLSKLLSFRLALKSKGK